MRARGHWSLPLVACRGIWTLKTVPPGRDSTVSEPSWRSATMRCAVARPSPVPWPTSLVVKKESKTCSRISGGMPGAVVGDVDRRALVRRAGS